MGMIGDSVLILISQRNEDKKIKNGQAKNRNLPNAVQQEKIRLELSAKDGNAQAAYKLGRMYIEGDKLGYDPEQAVKYFEMGSKKNNFNCFYALGMYYMAGWSYCHIDLYKSYLCFNQALKCKCSEPKYYEEVKSLLKNEFCISTKEHDKNGNPMVWTKHELKIK